MLFERVPKAGRRAGQPPFRVFVALGGRALPPADRLGEVTRDSVAVQVHESQVILGFAVTLRGGQLEKPHGLGVVQGNAEAFGVRKTQIVLGLRVAPVRGHPVVFDRLLLVNLDAAFAATVCTSEIIHRLNVAEVCGTMEEPHGLLVRGHKAETACLVLCPKMANRRRIAGFSASSEHREALLVRREERRSTERARQIL